MGSRTSKNKTDDQGYSSAGSTVTYPSPSQLREAQEKYALNYRRPPKSDPRGDIPASPTPDKKDDVYKRSDVDDYVLESCMKQRHAEMTVSGLVSDLTTTAKNDVEKLRAVYKWLTSVDISDYNITEKPHADSALYHLLLVSANRETLNHLFRLMANAAGFRCKLVEGTTRPASYYYGGQLISGHVWCVVYVENAWRLVDAQLAVVYGASDAGQEDRSARTKRSESAEFFFLTDPFQLIYVNRPDVAQWQLLAEPIANEAFTDLVILKPAYFGARIQTISETKGTVVSRDGQGKFQITLPPNHQLRVIYRVRKLVGLTSVHKCSEGDFRDFCFLENEGDVRRLNISLSQIGRYKIALYVTDVTQSGSEKRELCHYFLDVEAPDFHAVPLPYNPRYEYGPGADTKLYGIQATSHQNGMIRIKDGELKIEFLRSNRNEYTLQAELVSRDVVQDQLKTCMLSSLTHDGVFTSFIALPEAGRYLYKLNVCNPSTGSSINVCSYLIVSSAASCRAEPYPEGAGRQIGDVLFSSRPWLVPISHTSPFIDSDDTGELTVHMKTTLSLDVQIQLELSGRESATADVSQYTWFVHEDDKLTVQVTFPEAGLYALSIFAKPRGQEMVFKPIWIYVVNVDTPNKEALPFPVIHVSWSQACNLRQPLSGYILEESSTEIEVKVPGAKDVAIMTDNWACHSLVLSADSWWQGSLKAGNPGSPFLLAAMFDSLDYTYLLEYQTLSGQEFQKLRMKQKQALSHATTRLKEKQEKLKTEQDKAFLRQQNTANKIDQQREIFNKERNLLIKEEEEYRRQEREKWSAEISKAVTSKSVNGLNAEAVVAQQIIKLHEAKDASTTTRRSIHKGMTSYLMRERMREGTKLQDYRMLKSAVTEFVEFGLEEQDNDLTKAKRTLKILEAKRDLVEAMENNNVSDIQEAIDAIRHRGLHRELHFTVQEAERLLAEITKLDRLKLSVLGMDKNTMGEIRSYSRPPEGVHKVMQSALLLLGEDEYTTAEWTACQKICSLVGRESLNRRILDLDIKSLNREITARVYQILSTLDLKHVQHLSAGAAAFYIWATGTVEGVEKLYLYSGKEKALPADVKRQREIFQRPALDERQLALFRSSETQSGVKLSKEWID